MIPPNFRIDSEFENSKCLIYLQSIYYSGVVDLDGAFKIQSLKAQNFSPLDYYTDLLIDLLIELGYIGVKSNPVGNLKIRNNTTYEVLNPDVLEDISIDTEFATLFWIELGNMECLENLFHHLDELDFVYNLSGSIIELYYSLLNKFSIGQLFNITYSTLESALVQLRKGRISERQVFRYIQDVIEKKANRSINEGFTYHNYNRNSNCSQSELSSFFFNKVLEIDEKGLKNIPGIF